MDVREIICKDTVEECHLCFCAMNLSVHIIYIYIYIYIFFFGN